MTQPSSHKYVLDLDDTLTPFTATKYAAFNSHFGLNFDMWTATTHAAFEHFQLPDEPSYYALLEELGVYQKLEPYRGVVAGLQKLRDLGATLIACTARKRAVNYGYTIDWVRKYNLPFHDVMIVDPSVLKADVIPPDTTAVFEDSHKQLQACSAKRFGTVKVHAPWNQETHATYSITPANIGDFLEALCHRPFSRL